MSEFVFIFCLVWFFPLTLMWNGIAIIQARDHADGLGISMEKLIVDVAVTAHLIQRALWFAREAGILTAV